MKLIALVALLVSNLLAAPLSSVAQHAAAKKAAPALNGVEARIRRVEQGLLPPVLVKGAPAWGIEERMRHYKVPAVSVAVVNDFKVEWAKAYGVADAETKEPATTKTLFQAGSISKSVAATVALNKVEKGKLSLDEDINNKLTSWKLPDNEFTAKKKVTLANLLSHTAGLTVHGFPGYAEGEKIPTIPQVLDGAAPANTAPVRVDLEPGTRFRYSGGGTTIAQLAITDIERKPFPDIAREYAWEEFLPPPVETISVAPDKLDAYAGRYLVNPDRVLKVTREGARLFAEPTQSPRFELLPITETTFIRTDANVRYTFAPAAEGKPASASVRQADGTESEAPRVASDAPIPYELLTGGKSAEAVEAYRKLKKEQPDNPAVSEQRLNLLGYELLRAGRKPESVAVFALNAELYPQSSNVYDSLGEAYMESGDKELAVKNYRRSLELDPKNANAVRMLKKLEQK